MDYQKSGVNTNQAHQLVSWIQSQSQKHHQSRIINGVGGYASLFQIQFPEMKEPCLASSTDGVGTKLKLALQYSSLQSLGQDLVAMCVNDLICVGAQPLFFLDYYACGQLNEKHVKEFLTGVKKSCDDSLCALVGGETAQMPGVYQGEDFDCAGFAVGVVDKPQIIGAHKVKKGDHLLALASQGFHSNGYSLLRKIFQPDLDQWASELLKPTMLYVKPFVSVLKGKVHALAHITGDGMDNLLRVVPSGANIQLTPWELPQPVLEAKKRTGMNWKELLQTFNCGVGLVAFLSPEKINQVKKELSHLKIDHFEIGRVEDIKSNSPSSWNMNFKNWDALL